MIVLIWRQCRRATAVSMSFPLPFPLEAGWIDVLLLLRIRSIDDRCVSMLPMGRSTFDQWSSPPRPPLVVGLLYPFLRPDLRGRFALCLKAAQEPARGPSCRHRIAHSSLHTDYQEQQHCLFNRPFYCACACVCISSSISCLPAWS